MKATLVTAPVYLPVSLDEAKTHLRVDHTSDDGYIQGLLMAATEQAEVITRRKLITQTWKYFLNDWPDGEYFKLPFGQLQSVTSVKYKDSDGDETTWDSGDYIVDTDSEPGRIVLDDGISWPGDNLYPSNPIYIEFVCGYGAHTPGTVTAASNATPIVVTVATHGHVTGDRVLVEDVGGNTNANGTWTVEKVTDGTFKLLGSSGNAAYTSGGTATRLDVPEAIRAAIKLLVEDYYDNRGQIITGPGGEIPNHIMNLLWDCRLWMGA